MNITINGMTLSLIHILGTILRINLAKGTIIKEPLNRKNAEEDVYKRQGITRTVGAVHSSWMRWASRPQQLITAPARRVWGPAVMIQSLPSWIRAVTGACRYTWQPLARAFS